MIQEKSTVLFAKAFHGFLNLFFQLLDLLIYSVEAFAKEEKKVRDAVGQIKYKAKGLEQTATMEKMLSLNAAIEAGRAGKAGVGFGVVADEIGRMANESAAVYQEIQELVKQVEESMERLGE